MRPLCNSVKTSEGAPEDSLWEKSSYKTRFASNLAIKMAAWITSQDAIIMHLFKQWNFKSTHVCFQITPQTVCNFSVWLFPTLLSFSNMSSDCLPERMHRHTCCIYLAFSSVRFQMSPQITCPWGCKVTLVAFMWLNYIVSIFLQGFYIWIVQTKVIISKILLHCHLCVVFCPNCCIKLTQIIFFWSPIVTIVYFSITYFHFLLIWWEKIHVANFLQKLPYM